MKIRTIIDHGEQVTYVCLKDILANLTEIKEQIDEPNKKDMLFVAIEILKEYDK